ncbi:hypothetical protein B0H14DRAFT_3853001 [Mycena olivaceomarginata]|nr:hypothetical protein B0H14DRAFT_3853001 [Mycena olivaceomarginata]
MMPIVIAAALTRTQPNRSLARCIPGSRTPSLAALEKEAALLPVHLRIGRETHIASAPERRSSSTWYTDGSLLDGRAGGSAVRVEHRREAERVMILLGDGQVCEGEMEGLLGATAKALQDHQNNILCVVDSQATLRGILSTKPRSGQCRAVRYDKIIRRVLPFRPHLAILNLWTPAHVGTAGNELADEAAKAATLLDPDPSLFICPHHCPPARRVPDPRELGQRLGRVEDWRFAPPRRQIAPIPPSPPKPTLHLRLNPAQKHLPPSPS